MDPMALFLVITYVFSAWFMWRYVGFNLSLSSVLLSLLLVLHGPMYLYYTRIWGPKNIFFDVILSAAGGADVFQTMDMALIFVFISTCLGIKIIDLLTGFNRINIRKSIAVWSSKVFDYSSFNQQRFHLIMMAVTFFILLPFVFYEHQIQKVIEYITMHDMNEYEKIAFRREFGGSKVYLYNFLCGNFFSFLAFIGIAIFKYQRPGWKLSIGFFCCLLLLSKLATLSKAPPAIFVMQCFLVLMMTHRLSFTFRSYFGSFVLIFGLFAIMAIIANPFLSNIDEICDFLFYRVFMIPNESLLEYFSAIPYAIDFSWGSQFSWLAKILEEVPMPPTYQLVGQLHRGGALSYSNVMFAGDAWANFSWGGIIVSSVGIGMLVRIIDRQLIIKRGKTVLSVAGIALGHYGLFIAINTALPTALLTGGLLLVLPFAALFTRPKIGIGSKNYIQKIAV